MKNEALVIGAVLFALAAAGLLLWLHDDDIVDRQVIEALAGPQAPSQPPKPAQRPAQHR